MRILKKLKIFMGLKGEEIRNTLFLILMILLNIALSFGFLSYLVYLFTEDALLLSYSIVCFYIVLSGIVGLIVYWFYSNWQKVEQILKDKEK